MSKPLVNELDRYLGARLRKQRQLQGISAAALAEAVGTTQQQISRYENGENKLGAAQLFRMARCLGIPLSWFFQGAERIEPTQMIQDARGAYRLNERATAEVEEELSVLGTAWGQIPKHRRAALLQLIDTLAER